MTTEHFRALLIEDSEDDAALLTSHLKKIGFSFEYRRVDNGPAMQTSLREEVWDILICDYSMPRFSALHALEVLKRSGLDIPLIIVSGTIGEETAVEAMRAGARDYILKDNLTRLGPAISRELKERENRRSRHETEKSLKEVQSRARIGNWEWNPKTGKVQWSDEMFRLLGLAPGDVTPSFEKFVEFTHPDDRSNVEETARSLIATPKEHYIDFRVQPPGKELKLIHFRMVPILLPSGGLLKYTGTAQDITEARRKDESLRQSHEQILQLQKMDAVGRLAGGIAHDFNNMIAAIEMYCDLALDTVPEGSELRSNIDGIKAVSQRAAALTRQLLLFSRKQAAQPKTIDLNQMIGNLEKILRRVIGEHITLSTKLQTGLGNIYIDPIQIEQVILNLVVNARDAMPDGGAIKIETNQLHIDEALSDARVSVPPGHYVVLTVTDTGCGMDAQTQTRIFEPFFTTKPVGKGTGLGLSTTYGIVKDAKGAVSVYSESGRGAVFKVYLPLIEEGASEPQRKEAGSTALAKNGEVILIVEDEERLRELFTRQLKKAGYTVLVAQNGKEALELCSVSSNRIDLLLTDVIMPLMGGIELARHASGVRPGLRILFMSGYTDEDVDAKRDENWIEKPFSANTLLTKVRKSLDEGSGK